MSTVFARLSRHFRRRRMQRFIRRFGVSADTRILDVGGTLDNWNLVTPRPRLTLLNMPRAGAELRDAAEWVAGDGRRLPFRDSSFDIVFSNSVIEHVGDAVSQLRFAQEVARVGRSYWVQTPNRWFPVEQHLLTPFVHWLPLRWRASVVRRGTVWSLLTHPRPDQREFYNDHFLRDIRLLGPRDLRRLFPSAEIHKERFLGLTKALVAAGPSSLR